MTNQSNKLTSDEIQLLQKFGIDSASDNLKAEIENTLKNSSQTENQKATFRKANLADIDGIIKVQKNSLIDTFVGSQYGINLEIVEKYFANYEEKLTKYFETTVYFVAEINSKIVGVVAAPVDRIIRTMWVDPSFQRLGIGKKLMQMAIEELGDLSEIRLETGLQKNGQAFKFYEKLGFEKTGKESKIKLFPEQTGEVECIEFILKPEKIMEISKQNQTEKSETQDQNWIINNLGWIDVKPIFRDSNFKVFADLCEPIIKQDWDLETLIIETERLTLKPISLDYAEDIFREFTPKVASTLISQPLKNLEAQKEFIIERIKRMENRKQIMFVILDKSGEFLGVCNFHGIDKKTLTAGIWLKLETQNQGFSSEAMPGMTNWAKTHLNFESIKYESYQENIASIKIAQKLGGQFVQNKKLTRLDGKIVNGVEYQIKNPNYQSSNSRVQSLVIKNGVDKFSRSDLDKIQEIGRSFGLPGIAYIQFEKGESQELIAKSPILKFFGDENMQKIKQQEIVDFLGIESGDLVLFVAHIDKDLVHKAQNAIRKHVALKLDLLDSNSLKFVWIYDFPFFERDDKTDKIDFAHNPFGIFQNFENLTHLETLKLAQKENRLLELRAIQYDIACNGYEVLSGGRRNNIPECLMEGFKLVGYTEVEVKEKFGHMMEAYSYGAPTHAGFAWGIDRLFMVLVEEDNIRETIAFPKNGSGMDLMMNSPSSVRPIQLKELHIKSVE